MWTRIININNNYTITRPEAVAVGGLDDSVYVVGYNDAPDPNFPLETDAFVAKFSSQGDHEWTEKYITTSSDYAKSIEIDSEGNSYVVGFSENQANSTLFLNKFDPNGAHLWTTTREENLKPYDLVLSDDLVIVTGAAGRNIFAGAFLTSTGEHINTSLKGTDVGGIDGGSNVFAKSIAIGHENSLFISGTTHGNLDEQVHHDLRDFL